MTDITQAAFSYADLEKSRREMVLRLTGEIRQHAKVIEDNVIAIGDRLIVVKDELGHGQFGAWLDSEFRWSQDTAGNLMNIARLAKENPKFLEHKDRFGRSALIVFAQPGTPDGARQEALQRAESGEQITFGRAREIARRHVVTRISGHDRRCITREPSAPHTSQDQLAELTHRLDDEADRGVSAGCHEVQLSQLWAAVQNLQVAMVAAYGSPLRGPVARALSSLQSMLPPISLGTINIIVDHDKEEAAS